MTELSKQCHFGDESIAYLYNEMSGQDRLRFEDHLLECGECTDDFAVIADSRFAVYEWQKLEFAPLETPRFAIPYAEPKTDWITAIRTAFAFRPRFAVAGGVGLLFIAIASVAFIATSERTPVNIAAVAPIVEHVKQETVKPEPFVESKAVPEPEVIVNSASQPTKVLKPVKQLRKPASNRRVETVASQTAAKRRDVILQTTPRLNDFEDTEDTGLRLSDLVADSDTRD